MTLCPKDASRLTRDICSLAPIVPVLVIDDASKARPLAEAIVAEGLPAVEVTLRAAAANYRCGIRLEWDRRTGKKSALLGNNP